MGKPIQAGKPSQGFFFAHRTRYAILALSILCLTFIVSNMMALNFTIICMEEDNHEMFDASQRSWLFSAIAIGQFIGTGPVTHLTAYIGFRETMTIYGLISAVSTLCLPLAVNAGFLPLLAIRILQGFALSISFPGIAAIPVEWSPLISSGVYIALLSCHLQFSALFTMPVSAGFCESSLGWPAVYYLQGIITFVLFVMFYFFYTDSPRTHRNVSSKELTRIEEGKQTVNKQEKRTIPYRAMLRDKVVLGMLAADFGGMLGFLIFVLYGPIYLNKVLKLDVNTTGFASALPMLLALLMKFMAGPLSDRLTIISQKWRCKLFSSVSQFTMAGCFIALATLPVDQKILIQVAYTGVNFFSALNCVGLDKACQLSCRQYANFMYAIFNLNNSIATLFIPALIGFMAPDDTMEQWRRVFWVIAGICICATTTFDLTAETDPRPWTLSKSSIAASVSTMQTSASSADNKSSEIAQEEA